MLVISVYVCRASELASMRFFKRKTNALDHSLFNLYVPTSLELHPAEHMLIGCHKQLLLLLRNGA